MAAEVPTSSSGLGGLAQILAAISPILLGTGKTSETGSTNQQQGGTTAQSGTSSQSGTSGQKGVTSQVTGANPEVISSLLALFQESVANSKDATGKTKDIIDNLIHQSMVAFGPVLGQTAASGIYNSSTLGLLAQEAARNLTNATAQTVLNYKTSQQQIAAATGNDLINATKTLTSSSDNTGTTSQTGITSQTGNTTQTTQQTSAGSKQTAPVINAGGTGALGNIAGIGGGLLLKSLLSGDNPLKKLFGGGSGSEGNIPSVDAGMVDFSGANSQMLPTPSEVGLDTNILSATPGTSIADNTAGLLNFDTTDFSGLGGGFLDQNFSLPTSVISSPTSSIENVAPGVINFLEDNSSSIGTVASEIPNEISLNASAATTIPSVGSSTGSSGSGSITDFLGDAGSFLIDKAKNLVDFNTTTPGIVRAIATDIPNLFAEGVSTAEGLTALAGDAVSLGAGTAASLIGKGITEGFGQNATNASIGAAGGGLVGSIFGPIGTFVGTLLGDVVGGLFGPKPHPSFFYSEIKVDDKGNLVRGEKNASTIPRSFNMDEILDKYDTQLSTFNKFLDAAHLRVASKNANNEIRGLSGDPLSFGAKDSNYNSLEGRDIRSDLSVALPELRFSSDDPKINSLVENKAFGSLQNIYDTLTTGNYTKPSVNSLDPGLLYFNLLLPNANPNSGSILAQIGEGYDFSDIINAVPAVSQAEINNPSSGVSTYDSQNLGAQGSEGAG